MSALAMILAAGMAVGSGPENVSGEVERGLDLSGEWEGTYQVDISDWNVRYGGGVLTYWHNQIQVRRQIPMRFVDEGHGKVRLALRDGPPITPGIYKMRNDCIIMIFWRGGNKDRQITFTLHRVKPGD
jgi:hypothetical protein